MLSTTTTVFYWFYWEMPSNSTAFYWLHWEMPRPKQITEFMLSLYCRNATDLTD